MRTTQGSAVIATSCFAVALTVAALATSGGQARGAGDESAARAVGGKLVMLATDDVDWLDPGATHSTFGFMVASATQKPLYSFKPDGTEDPVPDLAEAPPEVSGDGSVVTVTIKKGIRFPRPVDREVTAADVKYAIERGFFASVANGYAGAYFGDIEGAKTGAKAGTEIEGITTPGRYTVRFALAEPTGAALAGALVLPLTAPVPEEHAARHDAHDPSTYGAHHVATGPYAVETDASGAITGHVPGKLLRLVRNPAWERARDHRPAYLDEIEIREGRTDTAQASREILHGASMVNGDFSADHEIVRQLAGRRSAQLVSVPSGGGRHIAMNTTVAPFDDVNVRRAVLAGFDREAMRRPRGGALAGEIATHVIPPGTPGHEEAGGLRGPALDYLADPKGDRALAASYFEKAGFSSGRYEGDDAVTMVAQAGGVAEEEAHVARRNFERLGFDVRLRLVTPPASAAQVCGVPAEAVAVCPDMAWSRDFPDGQGVLQARFSGVLARNSPNWSRLSDTAIDAAMERAVALGDPGARAAAWADVDRLVMAQAPVVPWLWDLNHQIASGNVAGVIDPATARWSLSYTALVGPDPAG